MATKSCLRRGQRLCLLGGEAVGKPGSLLAAAVTGCFRADSCPLPDSCPRPRMDWVSEPQRAGAGQSPEESES